MSDYNVTFTATDNGEVLCQLPEGSADPVDPAFIEALGAGVLFSTRDTAIAGLVAFAFASTERGLDEAAALIGATIAEGRWPAVKDRINGVMALREPIHPEDLITIVRTTHPAPSGGADGTQP